MVAEGDEQSQEKEKVMKITIPVPEGAPPGTALLVPVKGGSQKVKVKVPPGLGAGSTLILKQTEGSDEWVIEPGRVVPLPESEGNGGAGAEPVASDNSSQAPNSKPSEEPQQEPPQQRPQPQQLPQPQQPPQTLQPPQPQQQQQQQVVQQVPQAASKPQILKPKQPAAQPPSWEEQQRLLALKYQEQERRRQAGLEPEIDEDELELQRQRHAQLLRLQKEDEDFDRKQQELARMYTQQQRQHYDEEDAAPAEAQAPQPKLPQQPAAPPKQQPQQPPPQPLVTQQASPPVSPDYSNGSDVAPLQWQQPEEEPQRENHHQEVPSPSNHDFVQQPSFQAHPDSPMEVPVAYTVRLDTTVGTIDIIVRPDWAPYGARRFLELATAGDLDDLAFYRAIKGCIAQFGLPAKRRWEPIPDDPPAGVPFLLGAVSFAAAGAGSRRSALFICTGDMSHCLGQDPWETPIGAVAESSLDVLDRINATYGDIAEFNGHGPDTGRINQEGNAYLRRHFPLLTYIRSAWPLDWPQAENPQDVSNGDIAEHTFASASLEEQARIAAEAARTAQIRAMEANEAARLARQAASADHVGQAMQAAQTANAAANAAAQAANAARAAATAARKQQLVGSPAQRGQSSSPIKGTRTHIPQQVMPHRPSYVPPVVQGSTQAVPSSQSITQAFQASRPSYIPAPAVQQSSPSFVPAPMAGLGGAASGTNSTPCFQGQVAYVQSTPTRGAPVDPLLGTLSRTTAVMTPQQAPVHSVMQLASSPPHPPPSFVGQVAPPRQAQVAVGAVPSHQFGSTSTVQVVPPLVGQRAVTQQVVHARAGMQATGSASARTATAVPMQPQEMPTTIPGRQSVRPIAWDTGSSFRARAGWSAQPGIPLTWRA
mmetsp:Transcript_57763/g.137503  ORF Transcript_57763/g.137503 Transcript_57763/m.137503 type:complete len:878 (-) Transcript_57763:90-2723(-)